MDVWSEHLLSHKMCMLQNSAFYSLLPNCSTGALIRQILKSTSCHPIHTNIFWKSTSCLLIAPLIFEKEHHALYSHHFFWNWYSMSKFCFIFPPVFLKKVHHAKLIRIGFLRLRTPCLLFAPCFFKGEHGVLYSHHLKGIKYSSIAIRTSACIKQSRVRCFSKWNWSNQEKLIFFTPLVG